MPPDEDCPVGWAQDRTPCGPEEATCFQVTLCGAPAYCHEPPADCAAPPVCPDAYDEVPTCDGVEGAVDCVAVEACGDTIYCVQWGA